jgi:heme/copper-type cytochrome/quinol oxidase subunit 2
MHGAVDTPLLATQKTATHAELEIIVIIIIIIIVIIIIIIIIVSNFITIYLNSITTLSAESSVVTLCITGSEIKTLHLAENINLCILYEA